VGMSPKQPPTPPERTPDRPLTDARVRACKPRGRPFKLFDKGTAGLFLWVSPGGAKRWRMRYWFGGKERTYSIGRYPSIKLSEARQAVADARTLLEHGQDPVRTKQAERAALLARTVTFRKVAEEWLSKRSSGWSESYQTAMVDRLTANVYPWLGDRPIGEIAPVEILTVLRRMESRGALELAHRLHQIISSVFRYAVATGIVAGDPASPLKGAIAPVSVTHHAALTKPAEVGELLRAVAGYRGSFVVKAALQLLPLTLARPGELRLARWDEFDLVDGAIWRVPASRMKQRREHLVPLSKQALAILRELQPLSGDGGLVFPGERKGRPLCENALNVALGALGYKSKMTSHGFRALSSTLLNELGHDRDVIEAALAHKRPGVRGVYDRGDRLEARREMLQSWSDYLDGLKAGGKVVALHSRKR
jgi:integrase